jgi:alcohol dehydrogenase
VAIVGAGPIGLAALLTAQFYAPAAIILVDLDNNRLEVGRRFGATQTVNSGDGNAAHNVKALSDGRGVDTAIEAVGIPATFQLCQDLVAPGGVIANIGVHGTKLDPKLLITHRFGLDQILDAYETFAHAARTRALKVIIAA